MKNDREPEKSSDLLTGIPAWDDSDQNEKQEKQYSPPEKRKLNLLGPVITIFLLMIMMVIYTSHAIHGAAVANIQEIGRDRISSVAADLENYLEITKSSLWMTAESVNHMVENGASSDYILQFLIQESESQKDHFDENYTGIYGYVMGKYLDGIGWVPPADFVPTERDWYKDGIAAGGEATIVAPYVDAQTNSVIISIARMLPKNRGVLSLDVTMNHIQDSIQDMQIKGKGYGYIVTGDGTVVAHPDLESRGKNINEDLEKAEILSKAKEILNGNFEIETEEGTSTVFVHQMMGQWFIIIIVNNSDLYRDVWTQLLVNSLICTVIFILIILFYTLGYKNEQNYSRRIEEMRAHEQRKEYEARALKLEKESADRANHAKSAFLADMSHEIRTPINAVLGMNEMILRESIRSRDSGNCSKDMLRASFRNIIGYARNVESAGNNLLAIINNILDFSKIEAGRMEMVEGNYQLSSILNDLSNMIHFKAQDKKLDFTVEVDETLPDILYGDEVRLRQILTNLLNNAVKYTERGFVRLAVGGDDAKSIKPGQMITIRATVKDSGIGIRDDDKEKLFNKFQRLDLNHNSTVEGTGLGLAITYNLLTMMGGRIEVESEYGHGSEFTVSIPQKVVSLEPVGDFHVMFQKNVQETKAWKETFQAPDAHILAVDDTNMNLTVVEGLLKNTLMHIDTASSGEEALLLTEKKEYDLILMDQRMPKMDGTEAMRLIRAQVKGLNRHTPVVCLTADAVIGARDRYISEGFTDYLTKPIDYVALEEILVRYLPQNKIQTVHSNSDTECSVMDTVETDPDSFTVLRKAGINTETGLKYSQNDMSLYRMMLEEYVHGSREKLQKLDKFFEEKDWNNYAVLVHSIKSTSKMIGATELSDTAAAMEKAADNEDRVTLENGHLGMITRYISTLEAVGSMYADEDAAESENDDDEILEFIPGQDQDA